MKVASTDKLRPKIEWAIFNPYPDQAVPLKNEEAE